MSLRRRARELAVQALYAFELSQNPVEQVKQDVIAHEIDAEAVRVFAERLFTTTVAHRYELDEIIKQKAINWDFDRIATLDKLILRLAICEFLYFEDIPPKVSIDEAIEIAKKYSTARSGQFVNGILDAVLIELRNTNRLRKSGRGLIETTSQ